MAPGDTPVARPVLLLMVATVVALLTQVKVSPVMVFPLLSFAVVANCWVVFTAIVGEAGATVIVATGPGVTVKVSALLVTPFAAAVICVAPGDTPVARPLLLIVATLVALLAQVKVSPVMVFPLLSFAVAVNCWVAFTVIVGEAGVTVIVATGPGVTVKASALLVTPPSLAVI